ncbi:MAG: hypothetical protein GY719_01445 [bacterium]|nr:hypothetical protein [bacterium]
MEHTEELPRAYRWIVKLVRSLVWLFFRQVQVSGLEHVPKTGGGLIVAWHPNGLIDPGLIFTQLPRRVVFGARHGLFKIPILGSLMRGMGTVPIYRKQDAEKGRKPEKRKAANQRSLDALAQAIGDGSFAALFPEGISHDRPDVQALKTGVASLYYRARELVPAGMPLPVILPVGLHYDQKRLFGSNVLVAFHPPLELGPELLRPLAADAPVEDRRERYRRLLGEVDQVLHEVVYGTETWELYHLMHRARKLMRAERAAQAGAEPERPDMEERVLGFARFWKGYGQRLETDPDKVVGVMTDIRRYDDEMRSLGLQDHELDYSPGPGSIWEGLLVAVQAVLVYLFLPTLVVIGYAVNLPPALLVLAAAKMAAKKDKDEASIKMLVGALVFPLTWLVVGLLVGWGQSLLHASYPKIPNAPVLTGVLAFLLSALGCAVALYYLRLAQSVARAIRVRLTRARRVAAIKRLRRERSAIFGRVMALAEGLELPGAVAEDGRIVADPP